jgi:hypothetical protein
MSVNVQTSKTLVTLGSREKTHVICPANFTPLSDVILFSERSSSLRRNNLWVSADGYVLLICISLRAKACRHMTWCAFLGQRTHSISLENEIAANEHRYVTSRDNSKNMGRNCRYTTGCASWGTYSITPRKWVPASGVESVNSTPDKSRESQSVQSNVAPASDVILFPSYISIDLPGSIRFVNAHARGPACTQQPVHVSKGTNNALREMHRHSINMVRNKHSAWENLHDRPCKRNASEGCDRVVVEVQPTARADVSTKLREAQRQRRLTEDAHEKDMKV